MNKTHIATIETILRETLSPIAAIVADKAVSEIMITADGMVWVESAGVITAANIQLPEALRNMAVTAVAKSIAGGADIRAGYASSVISASVGGMRFAGALMPVDPRGTTLCIRKHQDPDERPTLEQLVSWGALRQVDADILVDQIIVQRKNAVFIGATSSGKTTLANAILGKVPAHERIGIIEDAQELAPKSKNCDQYTTNVENGVDARLMIKHAMRSRYDRLILGESRGDDTFDLVRALSSGHNGSMTTIHANSAEDGMKTLEMLYQMSVPNGSQIPVGVSRAYLAAAFNLLVYAERTYIPSTDGSVKAVRRVKEIALVKSNLKDGNYDFEHLIPRI